MMAGRTGRGRLLLEDEMTKKQDLLMVDADLMGVQATQALVDAVDAAIDRIVAAYTACEPEGDGKRRPLLEMTNEKAAQVRRLVKWSGALHVQLLAFSRFEATRPSTGWSPCPPCSCAAEAHAEPQDASTTTTADTLADSAPGKADAAGDDPAQRDGLEDCGRDDAVTTQSTASQAPSWAREPACDDLEDADAQKSDATAGCSEPAPPAAPVDQGALDNLGSESTTPCGCGEQDGPVGDLAKDA
jgi:hypothetical protein